jgi:hypothetical protein
LQTVSRFAIVGKSKTANRRTNLVSRSITERDRRERRPRKRPSLRRIKNRSQIMREPLIEDDEKPPMRQPVELWKPTKPADDSEW